ncbi:DUF4349 domain-containing protein [Algoriphagus yeomjeoni]|uniref:Uncharacterized protein DUF4349 n=1 Tax=Algoriphagus yeomjeoni TaxID=291403 RepID=A0A327NV26_9BACT|nr:DUF4349 domain-containing protein [Algoriphagus yeomjeoni]RAI83915.1 uncharacterized protein DUF4349 [Algoriphagus yeomjeoni]
MKLVIYQIHVVLLFVIAACGNSGVSTDYLAEVSNYSELEGSDQTASSQPPTEFIERKVIREGSINFKCGDILETETFLRKEVKVLNGFISMESKNAYGERTEKSMTIRVPSENFDLLNEKINLHALKIDNATSSSEDVTEQYIDVEARLNAKKELEKRYTELVQQAENLEEVLGLERELATVRGDIESLQGRINYLRNRISLSTLHVTFYQESEKAFGFISKVREGIKNGWKNLQWFVIFLVNLWPFFLVMAALLFLLLRRKKTPPPVK